MKYRALVIPLFTAAALSSIYLLPKVGAVAQSAVIMELPLASGSWEMTTVPPSEAEIKTLASDTKFSKAYCLSPRPGEYNLDGYKIPDRVDLSIVLSGSDVNNSIHRPERCMPAQGHHIVSSRSESMSLSNGREFPVKRLESMQIIPSQDGKNGSSMKLRCITYYFFVGHDHVTNDHLTRTFIDMKDRLVRGMDQRWAYTSVSMWYGKVPWIEKEVTEAEADQKLKAFLSQFAEKQINWDQISL